MINLLIAQGGLSLVGFFLAYQYVTEKAGISFLIGSAIVFFNFIAIFFIWKRLFAKKLVALSAFIIVFKYAILGAIVYLIVKYDLVDPLWFGFGIATFLVSALAYGYNLPKENHREE